MKVRDILRVKGSTVIVVKEHASVYAAIRIMVRNNIGSVLITDGQGVIIGVVSERDVLRICARKRQAALELKVAEIMTRKVIVGEIDDDLNYVETVMTNNRIRHLPIMEAGKIAGIISIGDVVKARMDDTIAENRYLKDYIAGKYPA